MRVKDAAKTLNVSRMTVHNWLKAGRLRLNKVLDNGYMDIDDASVYECVASTYDPSPHANRVVMVSAAGEVTEFSPGDDAFQKVAAFLKSGV